MKLNSVDDIQVGMVVWFKTSDMIPLNGKDLDQYALDKLHPYVCTGHKADKSDSQWLLLTKDQYRADVGRVFQAADKEGDHVWLGTDSYFSCHNCVQVQNPFTVIRLSQNDPSKSVNRVKIAALTKFGLDTMGFL